MKKFSVSAHPTKDPAVLLPDHALIRLDAVAHPERTSSDTRPPPGPSSTVSTSRISSASRRRQARRSHGSSKPKTSRS